MPRTTPVSAPTTGRHRHVMALALIVGVALGACSSVDDAAPPSDPVPSTADTSATTEAPTTTIDPAEARTIEQVNEYVAQAAAFDQAGAGAQFPPD